MLEDRVNNYLCAVFAGDKETGVCFVDTSTGEFHITVIDGEDIQKKLINQLSTYLPSEMLINSKALDFDKLKSFAKRMNISVEMLDDEQFDFNASTQLIIETLKKDEISSLKIGHSKSAVCALGAVIGYLKDTQKKEEIEPLSQVDYYDDNQYMKLDMNVRRSLEITKSMMTGDKAHSLLGVIDRTKTAMGKRMIRSWLERPLMSAARIVKRQNAVSELFDSPMMCDGVREALTGVNDIERLMTRIVYGTANAKELKMLQLTVQKLPAVRDCLSGVSSSMLKDIYNGIDLLEDVAELIDKAIADDPPFSVREGSMIKDGFNSEIDSLRAIMTDGAGVVAGIEEEQRKLTGIPKLKVGYNKVFGYYIEVTNSYKDMVPDTYIRKQTLTNCERYITQELKELEGRIIGAKERSVALEYDVLCSVRETVSAELERLQKTAKSLTTLDILASLAHIAVNNNYVCPIISADSVIDIKDGRHPVVKSVSDSVPFVPNDTLLDSNDNRCIIITGPNVAGKSTYMRQTALIVLLAQIGSFVPARSAKIGIVDAIFTRVGASDDLASGQSTFMVEINEVADILKKCYLFIINYS